MNDANQHQEISRLIEHLISCGALGRSPVYAKLLTYFATQANIGKSCSEYSVAIDVFGKEQDYDVTADSTVRVYIYNLRKKLETYYADLGRNELRQLYIPKGEYRIMVRDSSIDAPTQPESDLSKQANTTSNHFKSVALVLVSAIIAATVTIFLIRENSPTVTFSQQQYQFWGGILNDDKPIMIVVGDYYIFAETSNLQGNIRLVREFDVNSASDLRDKVPNSNAQSNAFTGERFDLGLSYLPRGSAYAITRVVQLLQQANKTPRISMMSEFSADDIRANHIIYIGYLSGLGVLESYTFANSRFEVGASYDAIIDTQTGSRYISDLIEAQEDRNFTDFGTISSFSLAADNQVVVLTGTRDAGLMEMSDVAVNPSLLDRLQLNGNDGSAFEALFEVDGFNLTNISSKLLISDYISE